MFRVVFFFQAEDGIRDSSVTGVQTCALPIYAPVGGQPEALLHLGQEGARVAAGGVLRPVATQDQHRQLGEVVAGEDVERPALEHLPDGGPPVAVEARRVADPQRRRHRASLPAPGSPAKAWATAIQR